MVLSDNWLIANNYHQVRLDLTIKSLSHPAGYGQVNQMFEDRSFDDLLRTVHSWSEYNDDAYAEALKLIHSTCLASPAGCSWTRLVRGQTLQFIVSRNRKSRLPMIAPFFESSINTLEGQKVPSFGVSSFGYDVRLQPKYKVFTNINTTVIDPLDFKDENVVEMEGPHCILPPNSYLLGVTEEYFCIPDNILAICMGKSTYARCGAHVNVTPIEPGFEGHVVIEISNATPSPLRVHAGSGIAQFLFFQGDQKAKTTYRDRGGKYQGQKGIQVAKC